MVARTRIGCPTPTVWEETTIFSTDKFFGASFPKSTQVNSGLLGVEDNLSRNASTAALSQSSQSCFLKSESRIISRFKFFPSAVIESARSSPANNERRSPSASRFSVLSTRAFGSEVGLSKMGVVIPPSWRMLVSDCVCIFPRKPEIKSCALEKLPSAFIERLSSSKITVLAGTSPDAADSLWSLPQSGRKPRAPSPVTSKQAPQSRPQNIRVLFVNAMMIRKSRAASGSNKKKRNEFQFITTILASVSANSIGMAHRIIKMIHCSSWICFRFFRRTDSSK